MIPGVVPTAEELAAMTDVEVLDMMATNLRAQQQGTTYPVGVKIAALLERLANIRARVERLDEYPDD